MIPLAPVAEGARAGCCAREGLHVDLLLAQPPDARHEVLNDLGGVFDERARCVFLSLAYGSHAPLWRDGESGRGDCAPALIVPGEFQRVVTRLDAAIVVEKCDGAPYLMSGHAVDAVACGVDFGIA